MAGRPIVGLRTRIKALSPNFLREGTGERIQYGFGLGSDAILDKLTQGVNGRNPVNCNPGFLPILASDRVITFGIGEPEQSKRDRLQRAFEAWQLAGSARSTLSQVLPLFLPSEPAVRVISTRYAPDPARVPPQVAQGMGVPISDATNANPIAVTTSEPHGFTTADVVFIAGVEGNTAANGYKTITVTGDYSFTLGVAGNGAYTTGGYAGVVPTVYPPTRLSTTWDTYQMNADTEAAPEHVYAPAGGDGDFDWDSETQVLDSWVAGDIVVVIYAVNPEKWCDQDPWEFDDANLTIDTLPGSIGLTCDADFVAGIRAVVGTFKGAHSICRWIIIVTDGSLFDPAQPADGVANPDGTFGNWHKLVGNNWEAARFEDAEYCDGVL